MKWFVPVFFLLVCAFANATPVLFDPTPQNNSYFGRGAVNFSINVSSSTLNTSSVTLFVISDDAYQNNEPWNSYSMQCSSYAQDNWRCNNSLTFSIVASDTLEYFYFEATDNDGKVSLGGQNASLRFKIDRTPPLVTFITPHNGSYVSGNVSVQITITDAVSGVNPTSIQFSSDNVTWSSMTNNKTSWNSSMYADNMTMLLYVRASDNVGNSNITFVNVTVDNEKPSITIVSPSYGAVLKDTIVFSMNVSDIYSGINTSASGKVVFGGLNSPLTCTAGVCSSSVNTLAVTDGTYNAVFSITDSASNVNTSTITITIKNTKPAITLTPSGGYINGIRSVNATITNPNGTITNTSLKIANGSNVTVVLMSCNSGFTSCAYDWNTQQFSDGTYILTASAGNTLNNNITTSVTLVVDNTKPSITATIPDAVKTSFTARANVVDTNYNSSGVNFTFDNNNILMTCLPQSNILFCEADFNPSYLVDGKYASNITAVDKAGNSFALQKTVAMDAQPPEIKFTKIEPIRSNAKTAVIFTVGAEDKGTDVNSVTIVIKTDTSQDVIPLTKNGNVWSAKVEISSNGGHTVDIITDDLSGNSKTYEKVGYFYIGEPTCGDNTCQSYENYCICAADCSAPACSNEISCASGLPICAIASDCGDDICSQDETCNSCQNDCGSCNIPVAQPVNNPNSPNPNNNPNGNPLGTGNGNFSAFIVANPLLTGTIGVILIIAAFMILKFRKSKYSFSPKKEKTKPFILDDKK